jgi:apolipoprotein N-acyltransferase
VRYGVEICKDLDFPALTRRYADARVGLLLAPAWDFRDDGWLHASMAVMRGVEQGLPLVRSAQSGELTVTDAYGRILAQAPTGEREAVQIALVPVGRRATLYGRWGDWFAGVSALGLGLLLIRRPEWDRR